MCEIWFPEPVAPSPKFHDVDAMGPLDVLVNVQVSPLHDFVNCATSDGGGGGGGSTGGVPPPMKPTYRSLFGVPFPRPPMTLFVANVVYNVALAIAIFVVFGGMRRSAEAGTGTSPGEPRPRSRLRLDQICTLGALAAVAVAALGFGLNIGFVALAAAVTLQLAFPKSSGAAETQIAWSVVLLVCGIVTYVAALQRYGTVDAVGQGIAASSTPLVTVLLLCAVGAVTSAFASSAGILGALIPLAVPVLAQGALNTTGTVVALALSATVVDSTPFSTVGALVVANTDADERLHVYRGLLAWGALMVITAPLITWLLFVVSGPVG